MLPKKTFDEEMTTLASPENHLAIKKHLNDLFMKVVETMEKNTFCVSRFKSVIAYALTFDLLPN